MSTFIWQNLTLDDKTKPQVVCTVREGQLRGRELCVCVIAYRSEFGFSIFSRSGGRQRVSSGGVVKSSPAPSSQSLFGGPRSDRFGFTTLAVALQRPPCRTPPVGAQRVAANHEAQGARRRHVRGMLADSSRRAMLAGSTFVQIRFVRHSCFCSELLRARSQYMLLERNRALTSFWSDGGRDCFTLSALLSPGTLCRDTCCTTS